MTQYCIILCLCLLRAVYSGCFWNRARKSVEARIAMKSALARAHSKNIFNCALNTDPRNWHDRDRGCGKCGAHQALAGGPNGKAKLK